MTILYVLDTKIISALVRNPPSSVAKHIAKAGAGTIGVSVVTAAELRYGCTKKKFQKLIAQIEVILDTLKILALDVPADAEYGGIRAELEAVGNAIGPNDFWSRCTPARWMLCWSQRTSVSSAEFAGRKLKIGREKTLVKAPFGR